MKISDFSILVYNENFSVVVENGKNEFRPYLLRSGVVYDPTKDFAPVDAAPRTKGLASIFKEDALKALTDAEAIFNEKVAKQSTSEPSSAPAPAPETSTPQVTLDNLIAQSVAQLSIGSVMATARPMLDKYIQETYGMLPKSIEVKSDFGKYKVEGQTHKEFETILKLVTADIPVFLTGPAGSGKNVICKQIADALGLQFYFSNSVTQEYKLTGFIDANGHYHDTQFFKAFTEGGVFMLDEIDASSPEVLVILNAAIANRYFEFPTGRVNAHKDFRIVAAGNTYGTGADMEYTGRYQLDASSLDRFCIIEIDYDKDIEISIAQGDKDLIDFVHDIRHAVKKSDVKFTISYRAIERLSKLKNIFDLDKAIKLAILRGLDKDDAQMIARNLRVSNKYTDAFKVSVAA